MTNSEMRKLILNSNGGFCKCSSNCIEKATDIHHLLPNTATNRNTFPIFTESPFNKIPLNNKCHLTKPLPKKPSYLLCNIYEKYLTELKGS